MPTPHSVARPSRGMAAVLSFLLFLFVLRVVGQLLVFLGWAPFLPPMKDWYSGLLPYGPLLATQVIIIAAYGKACLDLWRGHGFFAVPRPAFGRALRIFGTVYMSAMVVRYAMGVGPMIPIVFHWVLASFLLILSTHHTRGASR
jgi:hypothetical protein